MSEIDVPGGWEEIAPEQFDTRTFVSCAQHLSGVARAHVSYYDDNHTIEVCVDGEYGFYYHDSEEAAYDTARWAMHDALETLGVDHDD